MANSMFEILSWFLFGLSPDVSTVKVRVVTSDLQILQPCSVLLLFLFFFVGVFVCLFVKLSLCKFCPIEGG